MNVDFIGVERDGIGIFGDVEARYVSGVLYIAVYLRNDVAGNILNNDSSIIGKLFEIRIKGQVIMHGLDIGGQDLATMTDIGRARGHITMSKAHPAVGTVSLGDLGEGGATGGKTGDR